MTRTMSFPVLLLYMSRGPESPNFVIILENYIHSKIFFLKFVLFSFYTDHYFLFSEKPTFINIIIKHIIFH